MARKAEEPAKAPPPSAQEKLARLVALYLVRDMDNTGDQVLFLSTAGFAVSEVAELLRITEKHVTVATVQAEQRAKKKPKKPAPNEKAD